MQMFVEPKPKWSPAQSLSHLSLTCSPPAPAGSQLCSLWKVEGESVPHTHWPSLLEGTSLPSLTTLQQIQHHGHLLETVEVQQFAKRLQRSAVPSSAC